MFGAKQKIKASKNVCKKKKEKQDKGLVFLSSKKTYTLSEFVGNVPIRQVNEIKGVLSKERDSLADRSKHVFFSYFLFFFC